MFTIADLRRTMSSFFRLGNIDLRDVAGTLHIRNGNNTADAGIVAAGAKFTTSPQAGYVWLSDADGNGSWQPNIASTVGQALFTIGGELSLGSSPFIIHNRMGVNKTITQVFLCVSVAPTGAAIIVDIKKAGATIFSSPGSRPTIADGATTGFSTTIEVPSWQAGEALEMSVEQIGSGTPGSNLVVHVVYQ